jgi:hypothetical protein
MYVLEIIDKVKYLESNMNMAAYNLSTSIIEKRSKEVELWTKEFKKFQKIYHEFLNSTFTKS